MRVLLVKLRCIKYLKYYLIYFLKTCICKVK